MTEKICAVDLGMPTLLEAAGAEESAALCAELGLQFVELNMNLPEYADPAHMDREKLRALNLTLLIKPEETTDVPVDCVVRTDPAAGSVVKAGTTVTLYIRRDSTEVSYVTVPACIGSTSEQQASLRLTQRGLAMRVITVEDASPAGTVIAQSPNAGAMVMRGTVVTVTVSSGPPPVVAPPPAPPESESDSEESSGSLASRYLIRSSFPSPIFK